MQRAVQENKRETVGDLFYQKKFKISCLVDYNVKLLFYIWTFRLTLTSTTSSEFVHSLIRSNHCYALMYNVFIQFSTLVHQKNLFLFRSIHI
ncbi:hypothetical protein HME9304_02734 [Flagellimonas maritima]|uniref:Uncharacterized protein n=1 Tax=Flagellimonas maritima TaxID=1383885 RepID=A0A2Z4LWQ1_9FLAO|nr:hypothetical protein HME9304_02734 [Allomuricauda aurantiaca]